VVSSCAAEDEKARSDKEVYCELVKNKIKRFILSDIDVIDERL
jgi:hypothetical protein